MIDSADLLGMVTEEYLIGMGKLAKGRCLVCPDGNCYKSNYGGARKSDVWVGKGDCVGNWNARHKCHKRFYADSVAVAQIPLMLKMMGKIAEKL